MLLWSLTYLDLYFHQGVKRVPLYIMRPLQAWTRLLSYFSLEEVCLPFFIHGAVVQIQFVVMDLGLKVARKVLFNTFLEAGSLMDFSS